jgi:NAD(P)-dependent dehydrogenase (short-subunit alcohol dehydrogenase family)
VKRAALAALEIYGRIDVLVNNAGYGVPGVVEELRCVIPVRAPSAEANVAHFPPTTGVDNRTISSEDIRAQFQTNVFGPIALIQALLPSFRARHSGHILNVSSIAGFGASPTLGTYNASKAALDAFSETLAAEVGPLGVRVHVIVPGYFPTNFLAAAFAATDPERATGAYATPEQGHGMLEGYQQAAHASRQVGDPGKAVERMYEVVTGTGHAQGLMENKEWVRVPLGPDSGSRMRARLAVLTATVDAYEPIWSSTNMDDAQLKEQFGI